VYRVIRDLGDSEKKPTPTKDDRYALPEADLSQYGRAQQMLGPRLGIRIADRDAKGAAVTAVEPRSAGEEAGIKEADVIVSVNGMKPKHHYDLLSILGGIPEKTPVKIALLRGGKTLTKTVTLK
jgi:S1-C subfamily serine protease